MCIELVSSVTNVCFLLRFAYTLLAFTTEKIFAVIAKELIPARLRIVKKQILVTIVIVSRFRFNFFKREKIVTKFNLKKILICCSRFYYDSINPNTMMDPTSSMVSRPKSFNEGLRSASEHQSLREVAEDTSPPAMLTTTQTTAAGSASGQIPGPFQSSPPQYTRNPPSRMITSASEPAISAAAQNGEPQRIRAANSKIETIKNWSISTYKCTKQLMFEKLGKTSRTVDTELEQRIEHLRELKRKYLQVLGLSRAFTSHFYHVIQTQQALSDVFSELAQKSPELQQEFLYNAETQRNLHKNGEILLSALNFFLSSVNTLCNKTIEDTILTIRQYENSRLEYDAYRSDLELMLQVPKTEANAAKIEESQHNFSLHKQAYEKLRDDVNIKLQFLDENRIKVMHKQLLLFHNAISAYFSGNQQSLEATIKQFCIKPLTPNSTKPSWLEQQ